MTTAALTRDHAKSIRQARFTFLDVVEPQFYSIGAALLGIIMHYLVMRSAEGARSRLAAAFGVEGCFGEKDLDLSGSLGGVHRL